MPLPPDASPQQRLWALIHDIRHGMLTARHRDGQLRSRPMTTQNRALDDGPPVLWFFVALDSAPALDLKDDGEVNVAYADPQQDRYVSIAGRARFVDDPQRKQALWSKADAAWFRHGPDDPNLGLLAVQVDHAEYWDVTASRMAQLFTMARAAALGEPPPRLGEHHEVPTLPR